MKMIRFAALLLALVCALSLVACTKEATEPLVPTTKPGNTLTDEGNPATTLYTSGAVGDSDLTFELYRDGTLRLKGEGDMPNMILGAESGNAQQPWFDYIGNDSSVSITRVVVEDGITALSDLSFKNCINLKRVELGAGITDIPRECFSNCISLQTVVAKSAVTVQDVAFQNCKALKTITLSASLQTVWDGAFHNTVTGDTKLNVKLAGTAEEWLAAQAAMEADPDDELAIWDGNDAFFAALDSVTFVSK